MEVAGIRYLHLSENYQNIRFDTDKWGTNQDGQRKSYTLIIISNDQGVPTKVLTANDIVVFDDTNLPPSTNTIDKEGDPFVYSGSSGKVIPHLHIDKGQPGPNPLKGLPYTGAASTIPAFEIEPSANGQVSGKVRIIAGVESCNAIGGACSGGSIPDLNEVKMTVGDTTAYNPKL